MASYRLCVRGIVSAFVGAVAVAGLGGQVQGQCVPGWISGAGVPGFDNTVSAMLVWDDGSGPSLYAAGSFSVVGHARASRIARWDGANWSALGGEFDGAVLALTVYRGELIAAGSFRSAGGIGAGRIARWDGTSWSPLGSGIDGWVYALAVYNDELIAAGTFLAAGGVGANYIARWDGTN